MHEVLKREPKKGWEKNKREGKSKRMGPLLDFGAIRERGDGTSLKSTGTLLERAPFGWLGT